VADDDCHLRHHCAAVDRRCHRVVSATDHLRVVDAMNATGQRLVMDDLHAEGVKNEEKRHLLWGVMGAAILHLCADDLPVADVMSAAMRRLSADDLPVADAVNAARHLVSASPTPAPADALTFDPMQIRTAAFDLSRPILHSPDLCAPSPTAHHF
jgi:hypothetical protein